jgi:nicotinate phosphoribosyltransferase
MPGVLADEGRRTWRPATPGQEVLGAENLVTVADLVSGVMESCLSCTAVIWARGYLLNHVTFQTAVATKAARCVLAAGGAQRLDSGDLAALARMARAMLDGAGLGDARIFASGSLDEYAIAGLVAAGAPVDAYGVGTKMGVSADAPYLDSAYKLVAYQGRPVMKLSAGKTSPPGAKQVYRGPDADVLALRDEPPPAGHEPLLEPVMREGRRLSAPEPLAAAQRRCRADLAWLPPTAWVLRDPEPVPVRISEQLKALQARVARDLRRRIAAPSGSSAAIT